MNYYKIVVKRPRWPQYYYFFETGIDLSSPSDQDIAALAVDLDFMPDSDLEHLVYAKEISRSEFIKNTTKE